MYGGGGIANIAAYFIFQFRLGSKGSLPKKKLGSSGNSPKWKS